MGNALKDCGQFALNPIWRMLEFKGSLKARITSLMDNVVFRDDLKSVLQSEIIRASLLPSTHILSSGT